MRMELPRNQSRGLRTEHGIMDHYQNFEQLRQDNREGQDYAVEVREGVSGIGVMAPHGGAIEPGTATIADAVASSDHSYYAFKGLLLGGNNRLHISSVRFDEPRALNLVERSHTIITIHGCVGDESVVYVGGRDDILKQRLIDRFSEARICAQESPVPWMRGVHPSNLCNRGTRRRGVQLEITAALRRRMLEFAGVHETPGTTPLFACLVETIRAAMDDLYRQESERPRTLRRARP